MDYTLLSKQDAETSNAILAPSCLGQDPGFLSLALSEGASIRLRDAEDGVKLQAGIDLAKAKGVLDPAYVAEPYTEIDVLGQTPTAVAREIMRRVVDPGEDAAAGKVIVLCGLSGTGKGTTVTKLQELFTNEQGRKVVTWSNGNIFRSLTLVAVHWARRNGLTNLDDALTKENLASFLTRLEFGRNPSTQQWDTSIAGVVAEDGVVWVSDVQNTLLKSPDVSRHIPTVARVTQGEVVRFAARAIRDMVREDDNLVVLLEGRQQTVDYVRSPHRFVLTLSDGSLIGKRRAAQRIMAAALARAQESDGVDRIDALLKEELQKMV